MAGDLYVAASAAIARQHELDVVAHNLANADTLGFKRARPIFAALLESSLLDPAERPTPGAPGRSFAGLAGVATDFATGALQRTDAPLDVAMRGPGFFVVETPGGERYTRAGSFGVDRDGRLVTPEGHAVVGQGGPLDVGRRPVRILASGEVVDDAQRSQGRLRLVELSRPELLVREGDNLYRANGDVGETELTQPELVEGTLERSNVAAVTELSNLVLLQRSFDAAMQILGAQDQATQRLLREVGA